MLGFEGCVGVCFWARGQPVGEDEGPARVPGRARPRVPSAGELAAPCVLMVWDRPGHLIRWALCRVAFLSAMPWDVEATQAGLQNGVGTAPQSHSTRCRWVLTRPLSPSSVVTSSSPSFLFPEAGSRKLPFLEAGPDSPHTCDSCLLRRGVQGVCAASALPRAALLRHQPVPLQSASSVVPGLCILVVLPFSRLLSDGTVGGHYLIPRFSLNDQLCRV